FSPKGDGTIDATWCGHKRQYRRLPDQTPPASVAIVGRYAHAGLDMQATIAEEGADGLVLRMTSRFGVWTLVLTRVDHDLHVAKAGPLAPLPGAAKDWLYTVKVDAKGVLLDSDRTKHMRLARVS